MATSSMIHVRIDDQIKLKASEALEEMGLSVADAVRILLVGLLRKGLFHLKYEFQIM